MLKGHRPSRDPAPPAVWPVRGFGGDGAGRRRQPNGDPDLSLNKLTDAQLVLLSSAAQHPDGAIELELKGAAAKKVMGKLLRGGVD